MSLKIEGTFRIWRFIHEVLGCCCSSSLGEVMQVYKKSAALLTINIKRGRGGIGKTGGMCSGEGGGWVWYIKAK